MMHSRRARATAVAGLAAALAVPGAALATQSPARSARAAVVTVKNFKFVPATVRVKKGGAVTWHFRDSVAHNVKGAGGIKSKTMKTGSYTKVFKKAGTFRYICSIHPNMKGTIIVK